MELRQLKYFIKAAELSNFTDAAGALYISQSTLSQQIKQLEDELNIPLFDRIGKRVRVTEAGNLFLPYARKTVKESEDGRHTLKDLMNLQTGKLCIGVTYGLTNLLTKTLVRFAHLWPKVDITIEYGTTAELMNLLNQTQVDFVLSFLPMQDNKHYISYPLFESNLCLIAHQDHELAGQKSVTPKQLADLPLVLPVNSYSIRSFLDGVFKKQNLTPHIRMEINDINTLLQLADTGKWCTVLMATSLFNYPKLKAIPITGKEMIRQATITRPVDAYRKKAAIVFGELLREEGLKA